MDKKAESPSQHHAVKYPWEVEALEQARREAPHTRIRAKKDSKVQTDKRPEERSEKARPAQELQQKDGNSQTQVTATHKGAGAHRIAGRGARRCMNQTREEQAGTNPAKGPNVGGGGMGQTASSAKQRRQHRREIKVEQHDAAKPATYKLRKRTQQGRKATPAPHRS